MKVEIFWSYIWILLASNLSAFPSSLVCNILKFLRINVICICPSLHSWSSQLVHLKNKIFTSSPVSFHMFIKFGYNIMHSLCIGLSNNFFFHDR